MSFFLSCLCAFFGESVCHSHKGSFTCRGLEYFQSLFHPLCSCGVLCCLCASRTPFYEPPSLLPCPLSLSLSLSRSLAHSLSLSLPLTLFLRLSVYLSFYIYSPINLFPSPFRIPLPTLSPSLSSCSHDLCQPFSVRMFLSMHFSMSLSEGGSPLFILAEFILGILMQS